MEFSLHFITKHYGYIRGQWIKFIKDGFDTDSVWFMSVFIDV